MKLWAIVPVKPLRRGKSRLAAQLNAAERLALNRHLLARTIRLLIDVKEIDRILVVSRDSSALAIARELGARAVQEDGASSLNAALQRATAVAVADGADGVLIVPADLPLLTPSDVYSFVARAADPPVVVIAPDRHGRGTNALLLSPPGLVSYVFGPDSFSGHAERARRSGARLEIVDLPALALDLDQPEDLEPVRSTVAQMAHSKEASTRQI